MAYDYKEGKKRVLDILDSKNDVKEVDRIPSDSNFTYENGYYGWVTSLFVDIRRSTELFSESRKSSTAKIIRCFTSEIIEILSGDNNILREIGIRGDCVYAIFATKTINDDLEIFNKALYINSYVGMLNALLLERKMQTIKVGIGIASHKDLVIKAGKKGSGVSNKVWIGEAVTFASKLSNIANKGYLPILLSGEFYNLIIKSFKERNANVKDNWFARYSDQQLGTIYGCHLSMALFDKWIKDGMKDDN